MEFQRDRAAADIRNCSDTSRRPQRCQKLGGCSPHSWVVLLLDRSHLTEHQHQTRTLTLTQWDKTRPQHHSKARPSKVALWPHSVPNSSLCNHSSTLALVCPPYRWGSLRCPVRDLPPPPDTNTRSRLSPSSIHPPRNHPPKPQHCHPKMLYGPQWTVFSLELPPVRNLSCWPTYLLPGGFGWRTLKDVTRLSVRLCSCVFEFEHGLVFVLLPLSRWHRDV